jgi:hypothetical protein
VHFKGYSDRILASCNPNLLDREFSVLAGTVKDESMEAHGEEPAAARLGRLLSLQSPSISAFLLSRAFSLFFNSDISFLILRSSACP